MDLFTYYTKHSFLTDPGEYAEMFADLPYDVTGLCKSVQGLIINYRDGDLFNYSIPEARLSEIDTRSVVKILARIRELDSHSLTEERPPDKRFVGCCRDSAILFCAMARYRGIPTRNRIGFAAYFNPRFYHDHEIVECWDAEEQRWRLIDPEMSERYIQENNIRFDVCDVPRDQFIVAGLSWQRCRVGKADPNLFGVTPESDLKGWRFIRHKLVQDLAALNKMELLLWDCWGLMLKGSLSGEDLALLDKVAILTQADNDAFSDMQKVYEHGAGLRVTPVIMNYSPVAEPSQVKLAR